MVPRRISKSAEFHGVELTQVAGCDTGGCGPDTSRALLRYNSSVAANTTVVTVHAGGITTVETALLWPRIGPAMRAFLHNVTARLPWSGLDVTRFALAALVMHEACYNADGSAWKPYWDMLPSAMDGGARAPHARPVLALRSHNRDPAGWQPGGCAP